MTVAYQVSPVLSGARGLKRRPLAPHPLPRSARAATKRLTDADHFSMIRTAQRRFAPTVIGITWNGDRHQIGMSDRHRRNTQFTRFGTRVAPATNQNAGTPAECSLARSQGLPVSPGVASRTPAQDLGRVSRVQ